MSESQTELEILRHRIEELEKKLDKKDSENQAVLRQTAHELGHTEAWKTLTADRVKAIEQRLDDLITGLLRGSRQTKGPGR